MKTQRHLLAHIFLPKPLLPAKYAQVASTPVAIEVPSSGKKDIDILVAD